MTEDRKRRDLSLSSGKEIGNVIVSTGRGGTGKSTFVALASRYLDPPLLLLDIDPDQSLADILGVDLETVKIRTDIDRELNVKTISDLTNDVEEGALEELGGPHVAKIRLLTRTYCKYSSEKFDLFSLGPRWNKGDYTLANWLFEYITPSFGVNYANIIIDSPAGLEHLNRKVIASINDLFVMLDPSQKSIKHVERVKKITENVGIEYEHLYLVGNYEFDDESEQYLLNCTNEIYLGRMDYDANVKEYNLKGKSLLELSENSPACLSVKRILAGAGYGGD